MRRFLQDILGTLLITVLFTLIMRTAVVEARVVVSGSMLPTIQIEDQVLVNKLVYHFTTPKRGDVIMFDPPINSELDYVKRVIGLPGETIAIYDHRVYVDGVELVEPYLKETINYEFGPVTVPEHCYLVLGDNRNNSYDSHQWGIWLQEDAIKGKVMITYWPINNAKCIQRGFDFRLDNQ